MSCCWTVDLIWSAAAVNASFRSSNMNCGIMLCLKDVRHLRFNPIVIWYLVQVSTQKLNLIRHHMRGTQLHLTYFLEKLFPVWSATREWCKL